MNENNEILSLWVGPHAQKTAHHFYALQAEQFFEENEDPTNHRTLWNFKDKEMNQKYPRMIIFDSESDHLTRIRKINHKKLLKKMSQHPKNEGFFPFQYLPPSKEEEEQEQSDPNEWLYQNWCGSQENYSLINRQYNELNVSFELWEQLYKHGCDTHEDKIRKYLQKTDFLQMFTLCSDTDRLGFTTSIVQYLKDECPKRPIVFSSLSDPQQQNYFSECFLPLMGKIAHEVNILVDINIQPTVYPYFQGDDFYKTVSPIINCLYTPFMLKDSNIHQYLAKIQQDSKSIFNMAHALPIIDSELSLNRSADITRYLPQINQKTGKIQEQEGEKNRVNFTNNTFLNLTPDLKKQKNKEQFQQISLHPNKITNQSFVFKGNFKEIEQFFKQKTGNFELKYLKGIFAANPKANLIYHQHYRKQYGDTVENFPFHTVLFQHASFGSTLRNYLKISRGPSIYNQQAHEWQEACLVQADLFSEATAQDSD